MILGNGRMIDFAHMLKMNTILLKTFSVIFNFWIRNGRILGNYESDKLNWEKEIFCLRRISGVHPLETCCPLRFTAISRCFVPFFGCNIWYRQIPFSPNYQIIKKKEERGGGAVWLLQMHGRWGVQTTVQPKMGEELLVNMLDLTNMHDFFVAAG